MVWEVTTRNALAIARARALELDPEGFLVARSLVVFRDRGMTSAGLGVDAANPTGALKLYADAGFEVDYRSTAYRKPM